MAKRAKRQPGKPRSTERAITPADRQQIADLWLQGRPVRAIADGLGVHHSTVQHHLDAVRAEWCVDEQRRADQLAKVDLMERVAWERFQRSTKPQTRRQLKRELAAGLAAEGVDPKEAAKLIEEVVTRTTRTGETAWIGIIQWCADYRAKVHGWYAAQRAEITQSGEVRFAGLTGEAAEARAAALVRRLLAAPRVPDPH